MKRVLVTKPEAGTTAWGLVEEGKEQAKNVSRWSGERTSFMSTARGSTVFMLGPRPTLG